MNLLRKRLACPLTFVNSVYLFGGTNEQHCLERHLNS